MADTTFVARNSVSTPVQFAASEDAGVLTPYRAVADGKDAAQGAKADAAWDGSSPASAISILKAVWARLAGTLSTRTPGGLQALTVSVTRPANTTAYSQYDLIAALTSSAVAIEVPNAVFAAGESFRWEGARLRTTKAASKGKVIRLHVWSSAPTLSVSDNGSFNPSGLQVLAVSDITGYVGYVDVTLTEAAAAGAAGRAVVAEPRTISPVSGTSIWITPEIRDTAYAPDSEETFTFILEGQRS